VLQLWRGDLISWTNAPRTALFKWRQFEPETILLAVGWYLRFSLSHRDVEELEKEKGGSGLRYSFDIKIGGVTHEVGVDAKSGKLLENSAEGPQAD
jgi:hypothetical protein